MDIILWLRLQKAGTLLALTTKRSVIPALGIRSEETQHRGGDHEIATNKKMAGGTNSP
jgi:hypothetical protein